MKKEAVIFAKGVEALVVDIISADETGVTYHVKGTPICQYDQHSRARIGVEFFDYKVEEKPVYVVYTAVANHMTSDNADKISSALWKLEALRNKSPYKDQYNLMTRSCEYKVKQSWGSLRGQMMRRLKFCEEEFIVGLHWLLRHKLIDMGFKQAESFLPGCDNAKDCDYASADYLSNMFGCLFAGCNRWESHAKYASFNESCTTPELLEQQLASYHLRIPRSTYELEKK